jgi:predicted  nucleic acid-binding Zn-ribbon protein
MSVTTEAIQEEVLIERLLQRQPGSKALLERLRTRFEGKSGCGAFARIEGKRCSACNLAIAAARVQRARLGLFITCANCSRFLYLVADEPTTATQNLSDGA